MDLKFKGIAWVGNIYQKFETMCQEVDNIVSQDMVKYVENQAQTVGENVKKFCSDVVQDLHPSLVNPVKHEDQAVSLKRNAAIGTYIKSMIGIEENSVDTVNKQSRVTANAIDPVRNQLGHAFSEFHLDQLTTPTSVDSLEETEAELAPGQIDDVLISENSEVHVEESSIKRKSSASEVSELISLVEKESVEASLFRFIHCNHENARGIQAEVSPVASIHGAEFQALPKVGTVCDNLADDSERVSDALSALSSSDMALSVVSCEKKLSEKGLISSSSSLLTEPYSLFENSSEHFPTKAVFFNNPVDVAECVFDNSNVLRSSASTSIVHFKNKVAEMGPVSSSSVLSLESTEENAPRTDDTLSLNEVPGNKNLQFSDSDRLEAFMSSSNFGPLEDFGEDFDDTGMETIELCDKPKLEDSCVIVDSAVLYAVSCRTQKLRSYKKKIQDAFASKKRLAKEYEQLAIWFGDPDMGYSADTSQTRVPLPTTATLDLKETHHKCDSEWVLL